ncbi:MAG: hypothetical protein LBB94_11445 [Clostridiales bacterium]|jgi:ABC-type glycerol-3-phosphate transport system substrate-binding protein|nr:hypothetical protein [Clostridiales bacterium]
MKKRLLIIVSLAVASVMLFSACGANNSGAAPSDPVVAASDGNAAASESAAADSGGEAAASDGQYENPGYGYPVGDFSEPVTISMTVLDAEKTGNTARDKWLFDQFNIKFELIPVTWGDWLEKVRVMVAGDDIPDILWWDMKINHTAEFRSWAQAGAFREIGDTAAYPNLQALREKTVSMEKMLTVDGKLYGWSANRNNPDWLDNAYYPMFAYRRDWAQALNMYKEGDQYTWAEVLAMIDAVKQQDPNGNGAGNTFGMVSETWAFPGVYMSILDYSETQDSYVKDASGKYTPYFTTDAFRQELKFLADLYRGGYIWKDQIAISGSEGLDNFKAGRAFMYLGNNSPDWFSGQYASWVETGSIDSPDALAPMIIFGPVTNTRFTLVQTEDYWTVANFSHNVDDKKYERILQLWDWYASEDGRAYRVSGIPGVDYERVSDTDINILWTKTADGLYDSPYRDTANNFATPPCLVPSPNEGTNMTGYNAFEKIFEFIQTSPDYFVRPLNWDLNTFNGEQFSQYGSFSSERDEFIKTVLASSDDVDSMLDQWLGEMAPKWGPVAAELDEQLK